MTTQTFKPVNKIGPSSLGDPTFVRALKPTDDGYNKTHLLGAIIGEATGLTYRNNPNDDSEPSVGLLGIFEGVPADPAEPVLRSDTLFLPRSMQKLVVKALAGDNPPPPIVPKRGQKHDVMAGMKISIAVEIGVKRSEAAVGYEFVTVSHGDPFTVSDPLAELRGTIPLVAARAPALAIVAPSKRSVEEVHDQVSESMEQPSEIETETTTEPEPERHRGGRRR